MSEGASRIYKWLKGDNYPLGPGDPAQLNAKVPGPDSPQQGAPKVAQPAGSNNSANQRSLDEAGMGKPVGYAKGGYVVPDGAKGEGPNNAPSIRSYSANNDMAHASRAGLANGGQVPPIGPQTPPAASDTVDAALTPGEVVIPEPVVKYLGARFFMDLIRRTQEEMQAGEAETGVGESGVADENPFTAMAREEGGKPSNGFAHGGMVRKC
jgi:hypothetical protein